MTEPVRDFPVSERAKEAAEEIYRRAHDVRLPESWRLWAISVRVQQEINASKEAP